LIFHSLNLKINIQFQYKSPGFQLACQEHFQHRQKHLMPGKYFVSKMIGFKNFQRNSKLLNAMPSPTILYRKIPRTVFAPLKPSVVVNLANERIIPDFINNLKNN
jgi:uncharacterized protein VirK/YbjX